MKLIDVETMRNMDEELTNQGIPEIIPMEHAGKAISDVALTMLEEKQRVVIVAGKGNNGGDGFCAARWLNTANKKVQCFGLGMSRNEAMTEYNMLTDSGVEVVNLRTQADLDYLQMSIAKADLVIDALLGTGFAGELEEDIAKICDSMNRATCPVLSVDIPTGVNADTGMVAEHAVKAAATVTLARVKVGMLLYPARENVGKLFVADIGFPAKLLARDVSPYYLVDKKMVGEMLPIREQDSHKGDNGRVTVIAGSKGFVGAAALATKGAVKVGAGLISLLTPESASAVLAMKLDEEMVHPLPEAEDGLADTTVQKVLTFGGDVLAIGPGLGKSEGTVKAVQEIVRTSQVPLIIDADALTALKDNLKVLTENTVAKILTPHAGEFSRLTGLEIEDINSNRLSLAVKYAKKWNVILLLKGAPTIVALPSGAAYLVNSGTSAMATGGSGDVLTGVIAGLVAQGLELDAAAICGAYLHGLAGTLATNGTPGLAAGEIAQNLPFAWQEVYADEEENKFNNYAIKTIG